MQNSEALVTKSSQTKRGEPEIPWTQQLEWIQTFQIWQFKSSWMWFSHWVHKKKCLPLEKVKQSVHYFENLLSRKSSIYSIIWIKYLDIPRYIDKVTSEITNELMLFRVNIFNLYLKTCKPSLATSCNAHEIIWLSHDHHRLIIMKEKHLDITCILKTPHP